MSNHIPLLHLASRDINALSLATTAHGKVDIERGETLAEVALGDDVESGRVVKDMVVEREVTAKEVAYTLFYALSNLKRSGRTWG